MADRKPATRTGKLRIDAEFDDALRAALKVKPPEKPKRKTRGKKQPPKK